MVVVVGGGAVEAARHRQSGLEMDERSQTRRSIEEERRSGEEERLEELGISC